MKTPAPVTSRRDFIKRASVFAAAPFILPGRLRAQPVAPNQKVTIGCIGMGRQMGNLLTALLPRDEIQMVAVCDVDTTRREHARQRIDQAYSEKTGRDGKVCSIHADFRELLARPDIDAVLIATPDHWHALIAIAAVRAGKDVYCEKPLTYNIHEALQLVKAVRETNRVLQTGSQQRSMQEFRVSAELVRNGILGRVHAIDVHFDGPAAPCVLPAEPVEAGLDWKMWCGPGPLVAYNHILSPRGVPTSYPQWRKAMEFGGGDITNWGAHHIDIAQWALDADGGGPVEIRAPAHWQHAQMGAQLVYANGTVLTHRKDPHIRRGISFYGAEGEIHVYRGQFDFTYRNKPAHRFWTKETDPDMSLDRALAFTSREFLTDAKIKLPKSADHFGNFLHAIQTRTRPICDVSIGASSIIACHLMNCGYYYGANAQWDPAKNQFTRGGDPKWLTREHYTEGWSI